MLKYELKMSAPNEEQNLASQKTRFSSKIRRGGRGWSIGFQPTCYADMKLSSISSIQKHVFSQIYILNSDADVLSV